jgi:hypothetical protein
LTCALRVRGVNREIRYGPISSNIEDIGKLSVIGCSNSTESVGSNLDTGLDSEGLSIMRVHVVTYRRHDATARTQKMRGGYRQSRGCNAAHRQCREVELVSVIGI